MSGPERKKHVLLIDFDARIKEGIIRRQDKYKPSMSAPNAYRLYDAIYFTPAILITGKELDNFAGKSLSKEEKQLIFLDNKQYNAFLKYLTTLNEKKYNIETLAKPDGIIQKNISYMLNLFFGNKSLFYLGDKEYTIVSFEWNKTFELIEPGTISTPFQPGKSRTTKTPNVKINIRFLLNEGKETSFMQSVDVACAQKLQAIKDDYNFLTGYKGTTDKEKEDWKNKQRDAEKDAPYYQRPGVYKKNNLRGQFQKKTPKSTL